MADQASPKAPQGAVHTVPAAALPGRSPLSAVVISYNRVDLVGTCLRALTFADEIVVVDKSSTDGTADLAATLADRVISVPWTPTVEETRAVAVANCRHDWILCIDDDECLSAATAEWIDAELRAPRADIYGLPQRHYILGVHDEAAYYWPEWQPRLFRRDAVTLHATVHGGTAFAPHAVVYQVPPETGVCIHHLSHKNVAQWIEKANRYTNNPDRLRADDNGSDVVAFAHARIDAYVAATRTKERDTYPAAVAVLRATYDIIDRLKAWEDEHGLDGDKLFAEACRTLDAEYARVLPPPRGGATSRTILAPAEPPASSEAPDPERRDAEILRERVQQLRRGFDAATQRAEDERAAAVSQARGEIQARLERVRAAFEDERDRFERDRATLNGALTRTGALLDAERRRREMEQDEAAAAKLRFEEIQARNRDVVDRLGERAAAAEHRLAMLHASTSWRVTAPLRFLVRRLRRQAQRARLLARAAAPAGTETRRAIAASLGRRLGR